MDNRIVMAIGIVGLLVLIAIPKIVMLKSEKPVAVQEPVVEESEWVEIQDQAGVLIDKIINKLWSKRKIFLIDNRVYIMNFEQENLGKIFLVKVFYDKGKVLAGLPVENRSTIRSSGYDEINLNKCRLPKPDAQLLVLENAVDFGLNGMVDIYDLYSCEWAFKNDFFDFPDKKVFKQVVGFWPCPPKTDNSWVYVAGPCAGLYASQKMEIKDFYRKINEAYLRDLEKFAS